MSKRKEGVSPYVWQRHTFSGTRLPRSRTVRSFLLMVPWMTLMVMAVIFYCLFQQLVMRPGRVMELNPAVHEHMQQVDLPEGQQEEGLLTRSPTAILRRLEAPDRVGVTVLLLDDGRYLSDNPAELEALADAYLSRELNLIVDKDVPYGATMEWVERLKSLQVERINLVTARAEMKE